MCVLNYYTCVLILICGLIQIHMCPHTTIYESSYYYICVLILLLYMHVRILLYVRLQPVSIRQYTSAYVVSSALVPSSYYCYICMSSYYYMCVFNLPHTTICASSTRLCPFSSSLVPSSLFRSKAAVKPQCSRSVAAVKQPVVFSPCSAVKQQ